MKTLFSIVATLLVLAISGCAPQVDVEAEEGVASGVAATSRVGWEWLNRYPFSPSGETCPAVLLAWDVAQVGPGAGNGAAGALHRLAPPLQQRLGLLLPDGFRQHRRKGLFRPFQAGPVLVREPHNTYSGPGPPLTHTYHS